MTEADDSAATASFGSKPKLLRLALFGRPNSGKSTLMNRLLKQERVLVSDIAGTTVDPIDAEVFWEPAGVTLRLTDTAGIRRRAQQNGGIERTSALWSRRALERSDVGVLVVDAVEGWQTQDTRLLDMADKELRRCTVVAFNKWDALVRKDPPKFQREYEQKVRDTIPGFPHVLFHYISAQNGAGIGKLVSQCLQVAADRGTRFDTRHLNSVIKQVEALHFGTGSGCSGNRRSSTKRPRIRFVTQASSRGIPTFAVFVNNKSLVTAPYERFVEQSIRKYLHPFSGVPIQLVFISEPQRQR